MPNRLAPRSLQLQLLARPLGARGWLTVDIRENGMFQHKQQLFPELRDCLAYGGRGRGAQNVHFAAVAAKEVGAHWALLHMAQHCSLRTVHAQLDDVSRLQEVCPVQLHFRQTAWQLRTPDSSRNMR